MASTTTQAPATSAAATRANPLVLWHLLSLDAPTVAALWTWFLARTAHVRLPAASIIAMFLAVWILYAADRLLDARLLCARPLHARARDARSVLAAHSASIEPLEARHLFHHQHRTRYAAGMVWAGILLGSLLPHLAAPAVRLYLVEGALLAAWFLILHATPFAHRLPKEFIVGAFFAAAVFIPTVARRPDLRASLLPHVILVALVFTLNCLFIHTWENSSQSAHRLTRWATRHISALASFAVFLGLLLAAISPPALRPIPAASAAAALLLLALHSNHRGRHRTTLRAAADAVLLTPLLLLLVVR